MARDGQRVKALILDECANYVHELNGHRNYCLTRDDHRCVFFGEPQADAPGCGYFEKAVLPWDPGLQAVYVASRKAGISGHALTPPVDA